MRRNNRKEDIWRNGSSESRLLDTRRKPACILHILSLRRMPTTAKEVHRTNKWRTHPMIVWPMSPIHVCWCRYVRSVATRLIRWDIVNSKRCAVTFTCLYRRAVHNELIEEMTTTFFINSLRRFYAIREEVKEFRSDRGTNFAGATDTLQIEAIDVEDATVK